MAEGDGERLVRLQAELTAMQAQLAEARITARPHPRAVREAEDAVLAETRFHAQMQHARRESMIDQAEAEAEYEGETQRLADIRAERVAEAARRVDAANRAHRVEQDEYDQAVRESQPDPRHGRLDRDPPEVYDERDGRDYGPNPSGDTDNMSVSLAREPPLPAPRGHGRGTGVDRERAAAVNDPVPGSHYRNLHAERLRREVSPPPRNVRARREPVQERVPPVRPRAPTRARRDPTPPGSSSSESEGSDGPNRSPPRPTLPVPRSQDRHERDPTPPMGVPYRQQAPREHRSPPPDPRRRVVRELDPSKVAQRPVRFDGVSKDMRVQTWLRTLANYLLLCGVRPSKWAAICEAFLVGQAAAGWQANHPDARVQCTWDNISQWLITNFGEVNLVQAAGDKWHEYTIKATKLTNHTLVASGRDVRRVAGDLGRLVPEWELIDRYLRAVRSHSDKGRELEHILRRERDRPNTELTTLEEVIKLAGLEAPDETRSGPDHGGADRAMTKKSNRRNHGSDGDSASPERGRRGGQDRDKRARSAGSGPNKRDRSNSRGDGHRANRGDGRDRRPSNGGGRGSGGGFPRDGGRGGGGHPSGNPSDRRPGGYGGRGAGRTHYRVCDEHFSARRRANQCIYCGAPPVNGEAPHERSQCPLFLAGKPPKDHKPDAASGY